MKTKIEDLKNRNKSVEIIKMANKKSGREIPESIKICTEKRIKIYNLIIDGFDKCNTSVDYDREVIGYIDLVSRMIKEKSMTPGKTTMYDEMSRKFKVVFGEKIFNKIESIIVK